MTQLFGKCLLSLGLALVLAWVPAHVQAQSTMLADLVSGATGEGGIDAGTGTAADELEPFASGPMVGGTRGVQAATDANKSLLLQQFRPGEHHFRPRPLVPNPVASRRPTTFSNRFTSWRLGYVSDGVRGSYFR
jgi:hypothetical protein